MSKYVINESTLTSIGDAIRAKGGTTDKILVSDLATAITNLPTGGSGGGDLPEEALVLTGNCEYRFANDGWSWFIDMYGDKITTVNIDNMSRMFFGSDNLTNIPFDLNVRSDSSNYIMSLFQNCRALESVPYVRGNLPPQTGDYTNPLALSRIFYGCFNLRNIPEDWFETFGGEELWTARYNYSNDTSNIFYSCYSLRNLPRLANIVCKGSTYNSLYYSTFTGCYVLDEIADLPVMDNTTFTSNTFQQTFDGCSRLKKLTFATNEDGTAIAVNWKNQTIDLTKYVGMAQLDSRITSYNSGIGLDKKVTNTDADSYERLKNDPDWWTIGDCWNYCRYNHDSAVETINSLPDTSAYLATAGGTNTIKFTGRNGRDTDGGAINTLTEEEIAVATAKGWTVSLV